MSRKKEIANDIWEIIRAVYSINAASAQSEKQEQLITQIVEYIDTNLSTRRKKQGSKEKECLKE
jgi:hypothetical protein